MTTALVPCPPTDGIKAKGESSAHYLTRQLLLIESMGPSDAKFGETARRLLTAYRRQLEEEFGALDRGELLLTAVQR